MSVRKRVGVGGRPSVGLGCIPRVGAGRVGPAFIDAAPVLVPAVDPPRLKDSLTEFLLLNAVFSSIVTLFLISQRF